MSAPRHTSVFVQDLRSRSRAGFARWCEAQPTRCRDERSCRRTGRTRRALRKRKVERAFGFGEALRSQAGRMRYHGAPSNKASPVLVSIVMRERIWKIGKRVFDVSRHGLIMGVLNVTPDSFSDGGEFLTADKATERALQMAAEGAHIIDVGGESTHPGSQLVAADEELLRVIPVIENLRRQLDVPISIDTSKAEVARAGIEAGASIVNDVTGGRGDDKMLSLVAETRSAFIIMHMQGTPRTMQIQPRYTDVVAEISEFFRQQYARAIGLNIDP